MSMIALSQMKHAISTALKLSFIEVPGWDLTQVRATLDLGEYFDQLINRFSQAGAEIDRCQAIPVKRNLLVGGSLGLARIKGWYDAKISTEADKGQQEEQAGLAGMEDILSGEKFDYFDETSLIADWQWEEIMGDFIQH